MAQQPQVRIVIDLGEDNDTWVTVVPIRHSYPKRSSGVAMAIGEAAGIAILHALGDAETLAEKLAELERTERSTPCELRRSSFDAPGVYRCRVCRKKVGVPCR